MFPIRDHNPSGRTPYVVYGLMAINIAVFLLMLPLGADPEQVWAVYQRWALIPAEGDVVTFFSSMFLHAGFMHIIGNMLFLYIFGDNLEDELGHVGFFFFYVTCGVLAGLIHVVSDPSSTVPTVGASGAIAAVMGGYLLLFPKARVDILIILVVIYKIFPVRAWMMLGVWFALQLFNGATADLSGGGVAYWAHAGGFVVGLVFMVPTWQRRGGTAYWNITQGHPPHPEATYHRSSVPKVERR